MRILLVDDDPVTLNFLGFHLTSMGHQVESAETGEKAWEALQNGETQIVISDWNMPGLSGIDLCKRIRSRKSKDYVYFILITSYQGREKLSEAMDAGVDDFMPKPVNLDTLSARIRVATRILGFHRQINMLQDLLPICMYCKKIRDDKKYWVNVESYFKANMGTDFTHSLCPDCYSEKVSPQLEQIRSQSLSDKNATQP